MIVRTESRCRIGITWYSTEREAEEAAHRLMRYGDARALIAADSAVQKANIGIAQCGRATAFDRPGEYAVVTP